VKPVKTQATPVVGVLVTAIQTSGTGGNASSWALTDSNGMYEINTGLSTGTYTVKASNYDYILKGETAGYVTETETGIQVTAGQESVNNDFTIPAGGFISGTVTTSSGMPLFRAKITATSTDSKYSGTEYTDATGAYTITTGLETDLYTVTAVYQGVSVSKSNVAVTDNGVVTNEIDLKLNLSAGGEIIGRVSDATTQSPMAGASVKISGPTTYTVTTDEKGYYSYLVGAGSYKVSTAVPGYVSNVTNVGVELNQLSNVYYPVAGAPGFLIRRFSGTNTAIISGTTTATTIPTPEFPVAAVPVLFSLAILTLLLVTHKIKRTRSCRA